MRSQKTECRSSCENSFLSPLSQILKKFVKMKNYATFPTKWGFFGKYSYFNVQYDSYQQLQPHEQKLWESAIIFKNVKTCWDQNI